jgi:ethanolamine utilization protein EutJ
MLLNIANKRMTLIAGRTGGAAKSRKKRNVSRLFSGVDIGTANLVTVVVDEKGIPLDGEITPANVVREGMVMDYFQAIKMVETQLDKLRTRLAAPLSITASAVPPGTESGNGRITRNILEAAGLEVCSVIDEPTAASVALGITDGAVVDVGGGTTGISIIENNKVIFTADEPTGGFNFDLVIAGGLGISTAEAEKMKKDPDQQQKLFPVVKPVMEKIITITSKCLGDYEVNAIYLVGGSSEFLGFAQLMENALKIRTFLPKFPLLVTPLGIAMNCRNTILSRS